MKAEYTEGNIAKKMLITACAMLASTLAMSGYNMADTFFVGQLGGESPLAAMGFTFPVVMFVGCLFHGFGSGCMTIMAQAIGRGDEEEASRIVTVCIQMLVVFSFLLAVIGMTFSRYIFELMGATGETLRLVRSYMDIWFLGCVTFSLSNESNKILIAAGRPKVSSAMTMIGMIVNVILDPLMIFGGVSCLEQVAGCLPKSLHFLLVPLTPIRILPSMGIAGAALATVISQLVSAFVMVYILYRVKLLHFKRFSAPVFLRTGKMILTYGIPAMLGMLLVPVSNSITTWVTSGFGDVAVAGVAAASRLEMVAFVFPMAFGIPLMPMIAQNFGAGLYSRVRFCFKFAVCMAFLFLSAAAVILIIWSRHIVGYFTPEPGVQDVMVRYMTIVPIGFAAVEITRFSGFALVGCGHPVMDTALKFIRVLGIMLPMYLVTRWLQWYDGIFLSRMIPDVLGCFLCFLFAWHIIHKLPAKDGDPLPPSFAGKR